MPATSSYNISHWITAFRLRTLPLALSSIGMGGFLAASHQVFDLLIFILCCTTTLLLQILSNLANDYGDTIHGADRVERQGPLRMVQSGKISKEQMKVALGIFTLLALLSGLFLLYISFGFSSGFIIFLVLGVIAIAAAITYTAGNNPYGYKGFGDVAVLIFFGPLAVLGTYFLQARALSVDLILPALSCGLFSTAVLNINNIRDIESDRLAGKLSIPVRIGRSQAIYYHWYLLASGLICSIVYAFLNYQSILQFLFLLVTPFLFTSAKAVQKFTASSQLDPYLKQMALTTLLFVILFGLGNLNIFMI